MSLGFQTALSALNTAQRALQVIGNNLANASNPAYARQRVQLEALTPTSGQGGLWIGRGVDVTRIDRVADALLEDRLRIQESEVSRQGVVLDHLREIESLFGEPGANGLGATIGAFFSRISGLSAAPEDSSLRHGVIQGGVSVADSFRLIRGQLDGLHGSFEAAVGAEVDRINALAEDIAVLNQQIITARQGRETPASFLDRQEELLRELAQHVDVQATRDASGRVSVVAGGSPLVSPRGQVELEVVKTGTGAAGFDVKGRNSTASFRARNGRLAALQDLAETGVADKAATLDRLAKNLILEFNRVHATGVPAGGGWTDLVASNPFQDMNNSGSVLDDTLAQAGLPFAVSAGALYVNVTDEATQLVRQTRIDISPETMTVQGLRDALDGIPDLTALVDPAGRLRITASGGHRFDFSSRVLPRAALDGTFGSDQATVTGSATEPFMLGAGQGFTVSVDGGPAQPVTFAAGQFANVFAATAAEVAAAINGQVAGNPASAVDGRVVIRSNASGTGSTVQLSDGAGSPLATMGLATAPDTGDDIAVDVRMSGTYSGAATRRLAFRPLGAGTVGATPGLQVEVRDLATNSVVATLDVGQGYAPGTELDLLDGAKISFGAGTLSQAAGDRFETTLIADSDTADILAATGTAAFFTGSDAATIGVSAAVRADPGLLAAALSGASADGANALRLLGVQGAPAEGLDGAGVEAFYGDFIAALGGETGRSRSILETQTLVMESLDARRQSVSGVNLDEELLLMEQFQQTYQVAARFLQTVQEVTDVLIGLGR